MATGTIEKVIPDSGAGYYKSPDGTLIQWGQVGNASNGYEIILPVSFVDTSFNAFTSYWSASADSMRVSIAPSASAVNKIAINIYTAGTPTPYTGNSVYFRWLAIGRWK